MQGVQGAPSEEERKLRLEAILKAMMDGTLQVPSQEERPAVGIFLSRMAEKYGLPLPGGAGGPMSEIGGEMARRALFARMGGQRP